jgi:hypothetical protein
MTDSPGTDQLHRINRKARPNTSVRVSLPDALRDALADPAIAADLMSGGARVSFVADAYCTVDGVHALRHREFPLGGPSRGVTMSPQTIAGIVATSRDAGWEAAAKDFVEAFRAATESDLDVVRIFTLRMILCE